MTRLTCTTHNRSFFYFALLIVLGNWMLFNLFVAILLTKFFEQKNLVCVCARACVRACFESTVVIVCEIYAFCARTS